MNFVTLWFVRYLVVLSRILESETCVSVKLCLGTSIVRCLWALSNQCNVVGPWKLMWAPLTCDHTKCSIRVPKIGYGAVIIRSRLRLQPKNPNPEPRFPFPNYHLYGLSDAWAASRWDGPFCTTIWCDCYKILMRSSACCDSPTPTITATQCAKSAAFLDRRLLLLRES